MPSSHYIINSKFSDSFRCQSIKSSFDLNEDHLKKEFNINIPIEEHDWSLGVICGGSGTGKSTLIKKVFPDAFIFSENSMQWKEPCFIDDFESDLSVKDITSLLNKVGFSIPHDWIKPYSALSTGQKMRACLCRSLLEHNDIIIFDEFTSVVDRKVAKICCIAVSKFVKRDKKKLIVVSCHKDILNWLEQDWVYDTDSFSFSRGCLRRRQEKIYIRKAKRSEYELFRKHHYMSATSSPAAVGFIAELDDKPVAYCSVIYQTGKTKNIFRLHRTITLPDYQGIGIGVKLTNFVAKFYKKQGRRLVRRTSHPAIINYCNNHPDWKFKGFVKFRTNIDQGFKNPFTGSVNRITAGFEYVGEPLA